MLKKFLTKINEGDIMTIEILKEVKKMIRESAMYNVNGKCIDVLKGINEGLNRAQISDRLGISRQMVYVYISVLIREGYIYKRNCPYGVANIGKEYLDKLASRNGLVDDGN